MSPFAALISQNLYYVEKQGLQTGFLTSLGTPHTTMPSNSNTPCYYKRTTNQFHLSLIVNYTIGKKRSLNEHFICQLYNTARSGNVSGATDSSITQDRVRTCAFFAGRIWYSGLSAPGKSSSLYFSQIVQRKEQYGFCYQWNDPTSETAADLLPDDGGVV